ncbi:MAG: efflux RND transporter periplasmic adaptor subunit, partial [Bacteroidales bacterium]|nr:efflux RND transporter periplasmic adaptor subunit [Bacteroidales bacterium]
MRNITILLISMVYITMMSCKHNDEHNHDDHSHTHETETKEHSDQESEHADHDHANETEKQAHDHSVEEHNQEDPEEHDHKHEYKTAKLQLQSFNQIIKTSGEIVNSPSDEIVVVASNTGRVKFSNDLAEGISVNTDQILFQISGDNIVDNNITLKYNKAKADFEKAESDFERAEKLTKNNIISEKEYQQIELEYSNTKYEYELITKSYNNGSGIVVSPANGFVKEYFVEEGQFVETGQKLAIITKQNKLRLVAEVSQKYVHNLPEIESATFLINNSEKAFNTETLDGKLISYGKSVNSKSYYIPVIFEIRNDKELLSGSFAQVFLKGKELKNVIVVPVSALIE